jgi:hypothetical protein
MKIAQLVDPSKMAFKLRQLIDEFNKLDMLTSNLSIIRDVSVDTILTTEYGTVLVDATSAPVTVTLPDGEEFRNWTYTVKKIDASANNVIVDGGSSTIDGIGSYTISIQNQSITVRKHSTGWYIL